MQWDSWRKLIFSFVSGWQLETAGLGMGAHVHVPSQPWDHIWLETEQVLCILTQSLRVPMSVGQYYCIWKAFFPWRLPSYQTLTIFPRPLLQSSLSPEGRIWWRKTIRTQCSKVSCSPHCPVVSLCVSSHLLWEETPLMMAELVPLGIAECNRKTFYSYAPLSEQYYLLFL